VGNGYVCLSVAMEPTHKRILGIRTSIERSRLVAHRFIQSMIREYGKYNISTDGGTWYPQACIFLNVEHHFHSLYQKSIIERTIHYMKDITECFDGYFPCKKDNDYKLKRVMNWLDCFLDMHDRAVMEKIAKWPQPNCNNIKLLMRM
jgi:putative transposase